MLSRERCLVVGVMMIPARRAVSESPSPSLPLPPSTVRRQNTNEEMHSSWVIAFLLRLPEKLACVSGWQFFARDLYYPIIDGLVFCVHELWRGVLPIQGRTFFAIAIFNGQLFFLIKNCERLRDDRCGRAANRNRRLKPAEVISAHKLQPPH